ncbi:MAG: hypothetical protein JXB32_02290 [Deltaproteobacteria bacterium]|nr:hypothetical protein [Deltaproteobacteria bacterium]
MSLLIVRCGDTNLSYRLMVQAKGLPAVTGELRRVGGETEHRYSYPRGCGEGAAEAPDFAAAVERMATLLDEVELRPDETAEFDTIVHWFVVGGATPVPVTRVDPGLVAQLSRGGGAPGTRGALATLEACRARFPDARHVIVWDDAFYCDMPPESRSYLLPETLDLPFELRRRGYRGLLHAAATSRVVSRLVGRNAPRRAGAGGGMPDEGPRVVLCYCDRHAGVTAVLGNAPIWTTFGISPGDGLAGERGVGLLPIGALETLLRHTTLPPERLLAILRNSGGLGVDESEEFERMALEAFRGVEPSRARFSTFVREIAAAVGAAATVLGGLDALVFVGNRAVGSHRFRTAVCAGLEAWRIAVPADVPVPPHEVTQLSDDGSHPSVWAASINEDELVAREVARYLEGDAGSGGAGSSPPPPE